VSVYEEEGGWFLLIQLGEWFAIVGSLASEIWLLGLNRRIWTAVSIVSILLALFAFGTYVIIAEGVDS